MNADKLMTSR